MPEESKSKAEVYGATLLSGLLYCGHCGIKLTGCYCTRTTKGKPYHRKVYRDFNAAIKAKGCDGQSVYSAIKVEGAVLKVVHQYFDSITGTIADVWQEQASRQMKNRHASSVRLAQAEVTRLQKQQASLWQEVLKAITGESSFDQALLNSLLEENKTALEAAQKNLDECSQEKVTEEKNCSSWPNSTRTSIAGLPSLIPRPWKERR